MLKLILNIAFGSARRPMPWCLLWSCVLYRCFLHQRFSDVSGFEYHTGLSYIYTVHSSTVTAPARPIETIPATFFTSIYMVKSLALARQTWKLMSSWAKFCFSLWAALLSFCHALFYHSEQAEDSEIELLRIEVCMIYIYIYFILYSYICIYDICFLCRFSTILVGVLFKWLLHSPLPPILLPEKIHGGSQDGWDFQRSHRTKDFQPGISSQNQKNSNCRRTLPETNIYHIVVSKLAGRPKGNLRWWFQLFFIFTPIFEKWSNLTHILSNWVETTN